MRKLVFNSSMPRSGSELLQVLLHQNPKIYGSVTSPLLEYMFAMRANYELPEVKSQDGELMQKAFLGACKGVSEYYYKAITDREIIVDKNRGWSHYYEWVEQWCESPKMMCIVRDIRSIIASMERAYRKSRYRPSGVDDPSKLHNMTVEQRVDYWLNTQPIGLALQRTYDCIQRGVADNMLFIRYEDLTTNPQAELDRVYSFIEEEPFQHDPNNVVKEVYEDDSHYGIFGNHSVKSTIKQYTSRDWSDVLNDDISSYVFDSCGWYNDAFGYIK